MDTDRQRAGRGKEAVATTAGATPAVGEGAAGPFRAVLVSTYELGRQPFGLASPTAWLREAGVEVATLDLAVESVDEDLLADADLVAFYLPMHTATRIATTLIPAVRRINPDAYLCAYGLYAPMNERLLRELGVATLIGGEFEEGLVALADELRDGTGGAPQQQETVSLARQRFKVPDRTSLPLLNSYAGLHMPDGSERIVGYTEATRGCKHLCRHCPIVPVYGGRFRAVQPDVVLADVAAQVEAGAQHITFGDPDFFNGPAHALRIVTALHERFGQLTYDVTIKIEHLVQQTELLPRLKDTGCVLVTSAVESFDQRILEIFDKCHSAEDFVSVVHRLREVGLAFNPTFVAFTPWTSMDTYVDFLATIHDLGLVGNVAPVQYAIRLLIPEGSRLLELEDTHRFLTRFDRDALCHRWAHPDPDMDALQQDVEKLVEGHATAGADRETVFSEVCAVVSDRAPAAQRARLEQLDRTAAAESIPRLTEPWYCCAEPTGDQLAFQV